MGEGEKWRGGATMNDKRTERCLSAEALAKAGALGGEVRNLGTLVSGITLNFES